MKILKISTLLLTTLAFLWFFTRSSGPSVEEECTNEFSSNYYANYHFQLTTFLNQYPQIHNLCASSQVINDLFQKMNQPLGDVDQQRKTHEFFVNKMRAAIDSISQPSSKENEKLSLFLNDLTHWIYLQADMRDPAKNYFDRYSDAPPKNDYSNLMDTLQALRKNKTFSRSPHETTHTIDQYLHGNIPSFLFALQNPPHTKVLRMGYPMDTINRLHFPWVTPQMYPEFLFFIQNQPRHLYINLMKRKGSESSATHALEDLENHFPGIFIVTLDKNSDFYWQDKNKYPEDMDSLEFKELLLRQFIDKKGNFYWTKNLNREEWTNRLVTLLDEIHRNSFSNRVSFSQKERLDFIEISYLSILDALVDKLQPASMNITCRQCMDRGPSLYALWMLQKDENTAEELPASLLAPPLLIHNRPSHPSRITRFISAARRISSLK